MKSFSLVVLAFVGVAGALVGCNESDHSVLSQGQGVEASANVSDADVTANVLSALRKEPGLHGLDINVITTKGDVQLIGNVKSQAQIDAAVAAARAVNGMHAIHNKLVVLK
jgi:osmotically-inducible protein OsmY